MAEAGRRLVLASASPRRLELLRQAGLEPVVKPAHVDEAAGEMERPEDYVTRLARDKAAAVAGGEDGVVLAADTIVVLDGAILDKPADADTAVQLLRRLSGRRHTVTTAIAVYAAGREHAATAVTTTVEMAELDDTTVHRYVASGEPFDKAGGYGIQGGAAAFVTRIDGSYTNVVGLPLAETLALLRTAGVGPDAP